MPRTTDPDVKAIIATELDTLPFIIAASIMVDAYLSTAGLPETQLAEIERWWTAHLITVREPHTHQVRLGASEVTHVEGDLGKDLESSFYGQTVLRLDTSGTLRAVAVAAAAGVGPITVKEVLRA